MVIMAIMVKKPLTKLIKIFPYLNHVYKNKNCKNKVIGNCSMIPIFLVKFKRELLCFISRQVTH